MTVPAGLVEPYFTEKTLKTNTRLVVDGLTKRTISMFGSNGQKYRVISYYTTRDILQFFEPSNISTNSTDEPQLKLPSQVPELLALKQRNEKLFDSLINKSGYTNTNKNRGGPQEPTTLVKIAASSLSKKRKNEDFNQVAKASEGPVSPSFTKKMRRDGNDGNDVSDLNK
ncbi:UNVERIFIED_CONTAM: hypothetical protein HDU68_002023 [Siphonaria sp. JEL0065]|nr:hypothetical protein HDU68_002023 [Siphonaria sp. JEL0065]